MQAVCGWLIFAGVSVYELHEMRTRKLLVSVVELLCVVSYRLLFWRGRFDVLDVLGWEHRCECRVVCMQPMLAWAVLISWLWTMRAVRNGHWSAVVCFMFCETQQLRGCHSAVVQLRIGRSWELFECVRS